MATDFEKVFGTARGNAGGISLNQGNGISTRIDANGRRVRVDAQGSELPKAKCWINVGAMEAWENPETGQVEERFVSLAKGIAVDTLPTVEVPNSSNAGFVWLRQAQNLLRDALTKQILEGLAPGQDVIVPVGETGLALQFRHTAEERPVAKTEEPTFVRKLSILAGLAA